ncbi:hypothetical protein RND71_000426 [Anisodus tanguticus]|uniref:Magnesium-dependent phosphatase 1 n=1 Tax=Anisodus tanguticus TaxID=243964 RepID=A0AAE1VXJ8_9SOLA|nr:hypothetical protein RND71_000426 [Anisodus tanguticus]
MERDGEGTVRDRSISSTRVRPGSDPFLVACRLFSFVTALAAILCIAVNVYSAVRSFKHGYDVFDGIFGCYAVLIAIIVVVVETEWSFFTKFWKGLFCFGFIKCARQAKEVSREQAIQDLQGKRGARGEMGDEKVKNEAMEIMGLFQVLPRLVVFDLDYTLWPFYCECRSKNEKPSMYPQAKGILHAFKDKGVNVAIASRSPTPDIANAFLKKLEIKSMFVAQLTSDPLSMVVEWDSRLEEKHKDDNRNTTTEIVLLIDTIFRSHFLAILEDYPKLPEKSSLYIYSADTLLTFEPVGKWKMENDSYSSYFLGSLFSLRGGDRGVVGRKEIFSSWTHKTEHFQKINRKTAVPYNEMLFFDDENRNIQAVSKMGVTSILVGKGVNLGALRQGLSEFVQKTASVEKNKERWRKFSKEPGSSKSDTQ